MTRKSKSWASKAVRDLVDDLRDEAKNIYSHAGAFLMREVCDGIADLLEAAARKVRELEGEVARYQSELLRAGAEQEDMAHDVTQLEATVERLEAELAAMRQAPDLLRRMQEEVLPVSADAETSPDSTEGLTGGQGFR